MFDRPEPPDGTERTRQSGCGQDRTAIVAWALLRLAESASWHAVSDTAIGYILGLAGGRVKWAGAVVGRRGEVWVRLVAGLSLDLSLDLAEVLLQLPEVVVRQEAGMAGTRWKSED